MDASGHCTRILRALILSRHFAFSAAKWAGQLAGVVTRGSAPRAASRHDHAGKTLLGESRDARGEGAAFGARDAERAEGAGLDMRQDARRRLEDHRRLVREHRLHRRRAVASGARAPPRILRAGGARRSARPEQRRAIHAVTVGKRQALLNMVCAS
jgi:hypothetical protein